jgi:single-strand DNA-binding protein
MNLNRVTIAGNITRDPELRYTPKGTAICKFGMAINRKWKSESGEQKEEVTFVDVDAFGRTAENLAQYLKKGSPIYLEGRLKLDQWDDKSTGQKRSKLSVACETFQFIGGKQDSSESPKQSAVPKPVATPNSPPPEDDDVPF